MKTLESASGTLSTTRDSEGLGFGGRLDYKCNSHELESVSVIEVQLILKYFKNLSVIFEAQALGARDRTRRDPQ